MIRLFYRFFPLCLLLLLGACSRPVVLETVVDENESIRRGSPVMLDEKGVGHVVRIEDDHGQQVAVFEVTDKNARDKLLVGLVRIQVKDRRAHSGGPGGRIDLRTSMIRDGAQPLKPGERIRVVPVWIEGLHHYSNWVNWSILVGFLSAVALMLKYFSSAISKIIQFACVVLAVVLSYFAVPHVTPHAAQWLDRLDSDRDLIHSKIESMLVDEAERIRSTGGGSSGSGELNVVRADGEAELATSKPRPTPQVLAWSVSFLVFYLGLNLLLWMGGRLARTG